MIQPAGGHLASHVAHFGRLLRAAGLPLGPGQIILGVKAVASIDISDRDEFFWALHTVFVRTPEHSGVFAAAFDLYWREPVRRQRLLEDLIAQSRLHEREPGEEPSLRATKAATAATTEDVIEEAGDLDTEFAPGYTARESLRTKDFEKMDEAELAEARRLISRMKLSVESVTTRRFKSDPRGPFLDLRATVRASIRAGHGQIALRRRAKRRKSPPIVVLCDISGSMRAYTRMLLHFLHALTTQRDQIYTFLFGTRLTNATRHMRRRDPDKAIQQLGEAVLDWDGGTRIGSSIADFNRIWGRKILTSRTVVILISDGLDQQGGEGLEAAMKRLHRSCRRLLWLNPLLRYEDFEPQAAGIRAMIPHVDDLRTIHNLRSLGVLAKALEDLHRPRSVPSQWSDLVGPDARARDPGRATTEIVDDSRRSYSEIKRSERDRIDEARRRRDD